MERLWRALREVSDRIQQLEGSVVEARFRYLEATDKMLGKLAGRLSKRMAAAESRQDAQGEATEGEEASHYPPRSARRSNLRGW